MYKEKSIYNSKEELLNFLGIRENFLYSDFSKKYFLKKLPKKGGGFRPIKPPVKKLKLIQRKILDEILMKQEVLPSVYGLDKSKGILDNARRHQVNFNCHLVNLDIKQFFPNVKYKTVKQIFCKLGFSNDCSNLLTKLCTIDKCIPQGSPTSPYLSALALEKLDKKIFNYCKVNKFIFTRYFDDISISGEIINSKNIKYIENLIKNAGYISHPKKRIWFKSEQQKVINSVVIYSDNFDVTNIYKDKINNSFLEYTKNGTVKNWRIFMGNLAFYVYIDKKKSRDFFNKTTGFIYKDKNILRNKFLKSQ
ncbi:reverse transcriptase family protein [Candidatus Parcubacteria bacterium]|nr:reverse transcriptase family protein [Candidatus Parcubacteria bacterium]